MPSTDREHPPTDGPAADRPVVDAEWLLRSYTHPRVHTIDATYFLPNEDGDARGGFEAGHIPGAVFLDIDAVADPETSLPHMLPDAERFARDVGALGIGADDAVVVYDQRGLFSAARVWWMFRVFGHEAVAILDGGLPAWQAAGGGLESGSPNPRPTTYRLHRPQPDTTAVRSRDQVRDALQDGRTQVVDVRPAARFRAEAPEPRAGLRGGHMPGAMNLPFQDLLTEDGHLRSREELRGRFHEAGIDPERPVVTTCGSGLTAAIAYLAAHLVGQPEVGLYDGSWTEWGAEDSGEEVTR